MKNCQIILDGKHVVVRYVTIRLDGGSTIYIQQGVCEICQVYW